MVSAALSFRLAATSTRVDHKAGATRSEEHTSELQSHSDLVCRLLLEKKKERTLAAPVTSCAVIAQGRVPGSCRVLPRAWPGESSPSPPVLHPKPWQTTKSRLPVSPPR